MICADIHSFHYSDEHGVQNLDTQIAPAKTKKQRLGLRSSVLNSMFIRVMKKGLSILIIQ